MHKRVAGSYFAEQLVPWFQANKRELPWRNNKNPYYVWVSEIMLQQTRVDTVIPYFNRFIERFPTLDDLAEADEDEVLKCWEGLGYYSRARNLHQAVKEVKERYGSVVPNDRENIMSLRGVGPYTAGAVLSIAYGLPEPAVDGNVMRVLARYFLITEDIAKARTRIDMEKLLREIIPSDHAGDFTESIMELGALICTPRSPECDRCPVSLHCAARNADVVSSLPIKTRSKPPRPEKRVVAWIETPESESDERKFLIRKRPEQGLLANMWELPHYALPASLQVDFDTPKKRVSQQQVVRQQLNQTQVYQLQIDEQQINDQDEWEHEENAWLQQSLLEEDGVRAKPEQWFMDISHTFSHLRWHMQVYRCSLLETPATYLNVDDRYRWIGFDELEQYAFPNVFLKIIEHAKQEG